jgi:hypothetical protein
MKDKQPIPLMSQYDSHLIYRASLLLECDLLDPFIEATARITLNGLRETGHFLDQWDLDCPDCLSCLDMVLAQAARLTPKNPT